MRKRGRKWAAPIAAAIAATVLVVLGVSVAMAADYTLSKTGFDNVPATNVVVVKSLTVKNATFDSDGSWKVVTKDTKTGSEFALPDGTQGKNNPLNGYVYRNISIPENSGNYETTLDGWYSLTWKDALMADGGALYSLELRMSGFKLGSPQSGWYGNCTVIPAYTINGSSFCFASVLCNRSLAKADYAAGCLNQDVQARVLDSSGNVVSGATFLFCVKDLDASVTDLSGVSSSFKKYNEGITPKSGFSTTLYSTSACKLTSDGNHFYGGKDRDEMDWVYGFAAPTTSGTFTFTWHGASSCGTEMFAKYLGAEIVATAGPGGSISPSGTRSAAWQSSYTYTMLPSKGYRVKEVLVDDTSVGRVDSYTFSKVVVDHAIHVEFEPEPAKLSLSKSSVSEWTESLATYSLAGAVYGVYTNAARTNQVATITTMAGGLSTKIELDAGTYYVYEKEASEGYGLDTELHSVTLSPGEDRVLAVKEPPKNDPLSIAKHDAAFKGAASLLGTPQGGASLAGARYEVSYYDGYYSGTDALPSSPTRKWVIASGADGRALLDSGHKVSGADFYVNSSNVPTIPLGTVSVVETAPPAGYTLKDASLGDPKTYVAQVTTDGGAATGVRFVAKNHASENMDENGDLDVYNVVARGDAQLVKGDWDIREIKTNPEPGYEDYLELLVNTPQGNAVLQGAVFELYNDNPNPVVSPVDGVSLVYTGQAVCRITTDAGGLASSRHGGLNGWSPPSTWKGALAYGTYSLKEVSPPNGYHINEGWRGRVTITRDGAAFDVEEIVRGE